LGKLSGIRVLDLSRVLSGPYCTVLLADLGAEVIKIEAPHGGDDARSLGPFKNGESLYFALLNRGKKSVTLDLKDPKGQAAIRRLVESCDVLVENFRPGVAARLGIDYPTLTVRNPGLVYVSISGFGQEGPLANLPAYDIVVQAMSGLMSITGWPDGPPTRAGESLGDIVAGLFAAWAIMVGLFDRERTGRGTHIDLAMLDCLMAVEVTALSQVNATGVAPGRVGNRHPVSTPFDTYQASDGLVVLAVANDKSFARLASLLDHPEWCTDERFCSDEARTLHERELRAFIEAWSSRKTVTQVVESARESGVAASAIWDLKQALSSEQVKERASVVRVAHPRAGTMSIIPQPARFSDQPREFLTSSPSLGQDTEAILSDLGLEAAGGTSP